MTSDKYPYNNFKLMSDVAFSVALIRSRITLDKFRNKLFGYLDKKSKKIDDAAARRVAKLNITQYAIFRDVTNLKFSEDCPSDYKEQMFDRLSTSRPVYDWKK